MSKWYAHPDGGSVGPPSDFPLPIFRCGFHSLRTLLEEMHKFLVKLEHWKNYSCLLTCSRTTSRTRFEHSLYAQSLTLLLCLVLTLNVLKHISVFRHYPKGEVLVARSSTEYFSGCTLIPQCEWSLRNWYGVLGWDIFDGFLLWHLGCCDRVRLRMFSGISLHQSNFLKLPLLSMITPKFCKSCASQISPLWLLPMPVVYFLILPAFTSRLHSPASRYSHEPNPKHIALFNTLRLSDSVAQFT